MSGWTYKSTKQIKVTYRCLSSNTNEYQKRCGEENEIYFTITFRKMKYPPTRYTYFVRTHIGRRKVH